MFEIAINKMRIIKIKNNQNNQKKLSNSLSWRAVIQEKRKEESIHQEISQSVHQSPVKNKSVPDSTQNHQLSVKIIYLPDSTKNKEK